MSTFFYCDESFRSSANHSKLFLLLGLIFFSHTLAAQYQSSILQLNEDNRLVYHSDGGGNRILDFSYAGYKNGAVDLPNVSVVLEIDPVEGDNTAHIQTAIDEVSALSVDENGLRGTVFLNPGQYPIHGTLRIKESGVVLRGSGEGDDPETNTILQGMGTDRRSLIVIGFGSNSKWSGRLSGSTVDITSEFVPAGSRTIEVEDASAYAEGDNIIIIHPSYQAWLDAIGGGETHGDALWQPGEINMYFNRFVTKIAGNHIQFDVPIFDQFDLKLSQAYVYIYTRDNLITDSGIEDLRIDIQTSGPLSEDHVWNAVDFIKVEDCWAKNVTALHFGKSGFWLEEANRCTILDCSSLEPHSEVAAPDRYNFYLGECSNNILFKRCHASEARHAFVSNGTASVSGIVFTGCSSVDEYTASESHRRWGQGLLWDNTSFYSESTDRVLGLYNRGSWGTGHGWTGTNQVAWNISAPSNEIVVQKPPIGQNYAIGCEGRVTYEGPFNPHPSGWIEGTGEDLLIESLYEAQLTDRLVHGVSPDAPGRLRPTAYSYTDNETQYVTLEWLDVSIEETQYVLERSADNAQTFEVLTTLDANIETYTDADLSQEDYHYRLTAVNATGVSAYSNIVNALSYDEPDTSNITFQVNLREVTDLYEGGEVWLMIEGSEEWFEMIDENENHVYDVTLSYLEETVLEYSFGYQTGSESDTQYDRETVPAACGNTGGFRGLMVTDEDLILPAVGYGSCEELPPAGSDITDIIGTTIIGSNDDEPWIDGSAGAGSPPGEGVEMLIDNDVQTKYLLRAVESWIEISSDTLSVVTGYTITSANDAPDRDPKAWELQGWDEQTESWIALHKVVDNPSWEERFEDRSWTFDNDQKYRTYRLSINDINGSTQELMQMADLQIFGQKEEVILEAIEDVVNDGFLVFPNPASGFFNINSSMGQAYDYRIYDLSGQLIGSGQSDGNSMLQVNTSRYPKGVFVIHINSDMIAVKHKIILD